MVLIGRKLTGWRITMWKRGSTNVRSIPGTRVIELSRGKAVCGAHAEAGSRRVMLPGAPKPSQGAPCL